MRNTNLILLSIHLESLRGRLVQDVADHVEIACVHFWVWLPSDLFLSYEYSGCFTPVMRGLQACTVKFELLRSSETDHVTPLFHSSPMANLISGLLQVFHSSKLQKQQKLMSLLNMKLSVQAFVSACSPRVFFFFGPLWSPQWIVSLNVLHHYIHEPRPFLLHHWPFLTTFSSHNFSLAVLRTSWFINCSPSIVHSFIHQKQAFYFLNTLSLLVSKFISILNHTSLLHVLCSLINLSRESMEAIFFSTHLSLLLSFFHHSLCF